MAAHSERCVTNTAVREGPAGDAMERAVERAAEIFLDPCPDGKPRPTRRRYSRNDCAAWALLGEWAGGPITNITIDQRRGHEPSYHIEASGRYFRADSEEWWSEGSGETFPLAVCRLILQVQCDDDCEDPDTGEYAVPPEVQAELLAKMSQRVYTGGFIGGSMIGAVPEPEYGEFKVETLRETTPLLSSDFLADAAMNILQFLASESSGQDGAQH